MMHHIMEHTAHHVDMSIPLYKLKQAQTKLEDMLPGRIIIQPFSWGWYFKTARACKLYDFTRRCWTDFKGQATSVLMNRQARTRAWAGKTRSDVVQEVAAEYGYEGDALDVEDSGEGRLTVEEAIANSVPMPVITVPKAWPMMTSQRPVPSVLRTKPGP